MIKKLMNFMKRNNPIWQLEQMHQEIQTLQKTMEGVRTSQRRTISALRTFLPKAICAPELKAIPSIEEQYKILEGKAPHAFKEWKSLFSVNEDAYDGYPNDSCSVSGNGVGEEFRLYVLKFARGNILDIGCGPQPRPVYLEGYDNNMIYGIDPIESKDKHDFHFTRTHAEFLPYADQQFEIVITGTSLDHVLLLDETLKEIHRVLNPNGLFLVWISFSANAEPYDPYNPNIKPVDQYHLFHFSETFFKEKIKGNFGIIDERFVSINGVDSFFFCLSKKQEKNHHA